MSVDVRAAISLPINTAKLIVRAPSRGDADALFALHTDADYVQSSPRVTRPGAGIVMQFRND
jgi:hypothetical protein